MFETGLLIFPMFSIQFYLTAFMNFRPAAVSDWKKLLCSSECVCDVFHDLSASLIC